MDGTWVHTLEPGLEPISLSSQPPLPKPKPQRFQSVRLANGRPNPALRATPRRNSTQHVVHDVRRLDKNPHEVTSQTGGLGDLSLIDPNNRLQKLEHIMSQRQHNEESGKADSRLKGSGNTMLQTKALVRDCNWEQFKNRYPDETETFAIEVLLAHDDLVEQIEADQLRRLKPDQRKAFEPTRRKSRQPRSRKRLDSTPIDRIRINSAIILGYLSKVTGEGPWIEKPHSFLAPFNTFLHFQGQMEEELRALEDVFGDEAASAEPVNNTGSAAADSFAFLGNKELQLMMKSRKAYEDMRCYVDFVKTRLIPRYNMFSNADYTRLSKIAYRDLPSLFRVGELVIEPGVSQAESRIMDKQNPHVNATEPKLWRVCYISEDTPAWSVHNLDSPGGELRGQMSTSDEATHLRLYYLDFNGQRYSPVRGDASIEFFDGQKEITKLPVYPLRFHKDHERVLRELQERGRKFHEIVSAGNPRLSYQGWTLTKDPVGRDITARPGQGVTYPEYIDSDVIVDFHEAFHMHPWWKPAFQQFPEVESYYPTATRDEFDIIEWSDRGRYKVIANQEETIIEYDGVRELEWARFLETDSFVSSEDSPEPLGHLAQALSPNDLALLPARLFVYVLRNRSFINADIQHLKPVPETLNPFESLQLPDKHKVMIQSAVFGHLEKKKVQRRATLLNSEFLDQDIIRGKGRGLAVLLHGPPGVGKTATAEAIAHFYKKPLFPITSGDLGTDPWDVEAKLSEIFRLANLWDCILLLDEAETLLAQREKKDNNLQKSSLVSVFLRTLEYYSGILFLTTNRPDVMDEAVKSRVQVSLQYPRLGLIETLAIFQTNLDRLMDIEYERARITGEPALEVKSDGILAFAAAHFHRHEGNMASPPWNGRQIRNAFQIAPSIARYGHKHNIQSTEQEPYIGPEHFEKVEESAAESDTNRQLVSGTTDERGGYSPPSLIPHSSPNRQSTFPRRGVRNQRFSSEIQRNRFSGEFHLRQRSSSSVAPLYLPSTQQYEEKRQSGSILHLREPSPPWTPDLASVSDSTSTR
ncbi:hypothetical protein F5Y19DRAFT_107604 [Xylariaceae sp. FL1651]|nr:hypothetical protein F5Y19DRAFT_107604 [Xylariaceae sp. FL1651]